MGHVSRGSRKVYRYASRPEHGRTDTHGMYDVAVLPECGMSSSAAANRRGHCVMRRGQIHSVTLPYMTLPGGQR